MRLSFWTVLGLSFAGLLFDSVPLLRGRVPVSHRLRVPRSFVISGVASLSSFPSGDRGVSPADESSKSCFVLRGVVKRLLNAAVGGTGRGLLGDDGWLGAMRDLAGEPKVVYVPATTQVRIEIIDQLMSGRRTFP